MVLSKMTPAVLYVGLNYPFEFECPPTDSIGFGIVKGLIAEGSEDDHISAHGI